MNDLISRQAAIDVAKQYWYKPDIAKALEELPSAQPEQRIPQMRGWVCPVCGRGLSPLTSVCPCNNGKGWEITC